MNLINQKETIQDLKSLAKSKKQSILIDGPVGCGKTYLSKLYSQFLEVSDFVTVKPIVSELRDTIESCSQLDNNIVVCIENLDTGVIEASYTILKFLEEPYQNIYIVVTCRNIRKVPDTIISRSTSLSVSAPTAKDIKTYCENQYPKKYEKVYKYTELAKCMKTFSDADNLCALTEEQLQYIINIREINMKLNPVSNTVWLISHFKDKTECPIEIVLKYISILHDNSSYVQKCIIDCSKDIIQGTVPKHQALTKFIMDLKYIDW